MISICKICGKEYEANYPNSKYCSILCREMGARNKRAAWCNENKGYMTIYMREHRANKKREEALIK